MHKPLELQPGDPCPACGGTLRQAPQATAAQRAKADSRREDYIPLPPHYDTAPVDVIEDLGALWKCPDCGYPHRFKPAPAPAAEVTKAPRPV